MVGQFLETNSLHSCHLFVTALTEVGIVAVKVVSLHHRLETLQYRLFAFHSQTDGEE